MTEAEILKLAKELGWNIEHQATNQMLIKFAQAIMIMVYKKLDNV